MKFFTFLHTASYTIAPCPDTSTHDTFTHDTSSFPSFSFLLSPFSPSAEFLDHPATTSEMVDLMADLQVLGKADFKDLMKWRSAVKATQKAAKLAADAAEGKGEDEDEGAGRVEGGEDAEISTDKALERELGAARERADKKKRREKKKKHELRSKLQRRFDMGIGLGQGSYSSVDRRGEDSEIFALSSIRSGEALKDIREDTAGLVPLDDDEAEEWAHLGGAMKRDIVRHPRDGEDFEQVETESSEGEDVDEKYQRETEENMDTYYTNYKKARAQREKETVAMLEHRKAGMTRKQRMARLEIMQDDAKEAEFNETDDAKVAYLKHLGKERRDSDDERGSDEESEDTDDLADDQEEKLKAAKKADKNPLINKLQKPQTDEERAIAKAQRWFSQSIFEGDEGDDEEEEEGGGGKRRKGAGGAGEEGGAKALGMDDSDESEEEDSEEEEEEERHENDLSHLKMDIKEMPMTDKQKRKLKRRVRLDKESKREAKELAKSGLNSHFEVAKRPEFVGMHKSPADMETMAQSKKELSHRDMIKRGMGRMGKKPVSEEGGKGGDEGGYIPGLDKKGGGSSKGGFEIVPTEEYRMKDEDDSSDDSDDNDRDDGLGPMDDEERSQVLALGKKLLSYSKEKAFVDASYNRYAWGDDEDLPEWFQDDERQHLRPQLPVTKKECEAERLRFMEIASAPIKKVAEARARKRKRELVKVENAKKLANKVRRREKDSRVWGREERRERKTKGERRKVMKRRFTNVITIHTLTRFMSFPSQTCFISSSLS